MTFTTPVISTDLALALARTVVGLVIAAHGAQKVFGAWGGPGLRGWTEGMARMGMRPARFWGLVTALTEFVGGIALAAGFLVPITAALVTVQMATALARVHWPKGFWVGKGGIEFTLVLLAIAAINGVAEPGAWSLDRVLGIPALGAGAYAAVLVISWLAYLAGSRLATARTAASQKAA